MLDWIARTWASSTGHLGGGWGSAAGAGHAAALAAREREARRANDIRHVNRAVGGVLVFSGLVLLLSGWRAQAIGPVFLWGIASLASGGAVGFLFGIPRAGSAAAAAAARPAADVVPAAPPGGDDAPPPAAPPAPPGGSGSAALRPNTNLEEVSDWLTKIIVGLGLVHLKDLGSLVAATAANAAAAFAATPTASHVSMATALIVGFAIEGFFLGYIYTRLFLQVAFARSDSDLQSSSRAAMDDLVAQTPIEKLEIRQGGGRAAAPSEASLPSPAQQALAEQVRRLAENDPRAAVEKMDALAREYERTRASMPSGPTRTQAMHGIVSRMTVLALGAESQLERLTASTQPGDRLAAVVILKLRFQPAYTDWLARRLIDDVPFIGFQAASALLAAARLVGGAELEAVRAAVQRARDALAAKGWLNDPPRDSLIEQILAPVAQPTPPGTAADDDAPAPAGA